MPNNKTIYTVILMVSLVSNIWLVYLWSGNTASSSAERSSQSTAEETVKLYSDGKIVDQWEATGSGQWSDGTYVFRVGEGAYHKEVRIHGTFSVVRTR